MPSQGSDSDTPRLTFAYRSEGSHGKVTVGCGCFLRDGHSLLKPPPESCGLVSWPLGAEERHRRPRREVGVWGGCGQNPSVLGFPEGLLPPIPTLPLLAICVIPKFWILGTEDAPEDPGNRPAPKATK